MISRPYKHGDNWRIDVTEEAWNYYIEFLNYEEAWNYYDYNVMSESD